MLPSPPAHGYYQQPSTSLAPPSPPVLDLEPSPIYSPLSTPSQSPKPPPSPCIDRDCERQMRDLRSRIETLQRQQERPPPPPDTLSIDDIALRSTLRLLMLQRDRAKRDIHSLEEMREAALKEPLEFVSFIQAQKSGRGRTAFAGKELPRPQEIYKCPNIEWSQYRVLGAPLDALHEKQLRRSSPPPGVPPSMQTGGIIGMPSDEGLRFLGMRQQGSVGS